MSARDDVLRAIQARLGPTPESPALPAGEVPARPPPLGNRAARIATFSAALTAVGGRVHRVADDGEAARVLQELAQGRGWRRLARSDAARLQPLCDALQDVFWIEPTPFPADPEARAPLFECDAGLSTCQAAVAETGTLVLDSSRELHRLASLVPPVHVALLDAAAIVEDLGALFTGLAAQEPPPTLTLVTGPSRTADIELELVMGVHGPAELHVLLVDGPGSVHGDRCRPASGTPE